MDLNDLTKIGFTNGEIKVYSALLLLGECTKTALAKKAGVAPSNIYDITNRLLEKGVVSKVLKNGVAHFTAANPRHILGFVEKKQAELEKEKKIALQLLPMLLQESAKTNAMDNVEVFYGWNGLKTVFEDLLSECGKNDENFVFGASVGENSTQSDLFFLKYSKAREKKGIKTFILFNKLVRNRKKRIDFFLNSRSYSVKFLDQNTPSEIMLYKDKTCILILSKDPLAIRITGKQVRDSFKQYFDVLWREGTTN